MTSDAPKRLSFKYDSDEDMVLLESDPEGKYVTYDTALAMAAAESEACAAICSEYEDWVASWGYDRNHAAATVASSECAAKIRARTPDDAKAALGRMLKAEREKALRLAATACTCHTCERRILALIDGDEG